MATTKKESGAAKSGGGFSAAERAAVKQRAAELRAESAPAAGGTKKERESRACDEAIAGLSGTDRAVAEMLDRVVAEVAPQLDRKTWYGFPSYARDGKVVVFHQYAAKFGTRYGTISFNEDARLDDGSHWPVSFAVMAVDADVEAAIRELVRKAAG